MKKTYRKLSTSKKTLFFMVSALTLVSSWRSRSARDSDPIRSFFIRRLFRIAPLFWCAAAIYSTVDVIFVHPFWATSAITPLSLLLTVIFCHGWNPNTINLVVPGGWSIAAEMFFYLAFPALMLVVTNLRRALAFYCVAVLVAMRANQAVLSAFDPHTPLLRQFGYYWFPNQLPTFALGIATFYLLPWAHNAGTTVALSLLGYGAVLLMVLAFVWMPYVPSLAHPTIWRDLVADLAFVAIILSLAAMPWGFLVNAWTRHIGKVSFGAYLWQWVALAVLHPFMAKLHLTDWESIFFMPVVFAGITAATVCAATVTYRWIEEPAIRAGQAIADR